MYYILDSTIPYEIKEMKPPAAEARALREIQTAELRWRLNIDDLDLGPRKAQSIMWLTVF
ncbi:hypothetical protein PILCRDRAFT_816940 [Piloderma croceum F 1598]|uniref:Uncharacterized protein n=1 Tax=Piloderma croceum (strain F 1598) TaxID=765440 RepID=A0A0C3FP87_PILCF|nr:hypothetical protein PILCRDRAFT_816940 [Piloderma croceum F 1598]